VLKLLLAGAVAVPVAVGGAVAATGVVVVDVQEARGGHHIVVPVPLVLAQVAAAFVPESRLHVHMDRDAERYLPVAREALEALADAPDGELVRVEEPDQQVQVVKEGRRLRVHVEGRDEKVDVTLPLDLALSALPDAHGRIHASRTAWALQQARFSKLVEVEGKDGERVKVTIF
jgi:hypothetical protein